MRKLKNSLSQNVTDKKRNDNLQRLSMEVSKSNFDTVVTKEDIATAIEDDYGVLYSPGGTRLLKCNNNSNLRNYTIKAGVKVICDYAFRENKTLTSITLPKGLKAIGNSAFSGCTYLTSVNFPKGLKTIKSCAFDNCITLTTVTLPDGLISIENRAFNGCYDLASINLPESLVSLGEGAFWSTNLTAVTLPKRLVFIEKETFRSCRRLTSINLPDGLVYLGADSFYECENLTSIELPESLQEIEGNPFGSCGVSMHLDVDIHYEGNGINITSKSPLFKVENGLLIQGDRVISVIGTPTSVIIPDGITSIEDRVFSKSYKLTTITLPKGLKSIGSWAFSNCVNLTSIDLPNELVDIGRGLFFRCYKLASIILPEALFSLEEDMFWDCINLTSITLPERLVNIKENVFPEGNHIEKVYVRCSDNALKPIVIKKFKSLLPNRLKKKIEIIDEFKEGQPQNAEEVYAVFEDGRIVIIKGYNMKIAYELFRHLDIWPTGGHTTDIIEVSREIGYRYKVSVDVKASFDINQKGHVKVPIVTVSDYSIVDRYMDDYEEEDVPAMVVINKREVGRILQKLIQDNLDVLL